MADRFFTAIFSASRADALIGQIQAGLGAALLSADTALVLADEACGQALIDRIAAWLAQEMGREAVLALPALGREGDQAQVQIMLGQTGASAFGPLSDWSFDTLSQVMKAEMGGSCLVSADPRMPFFPQRLQLMQEASGAYLLGAMGAPSGSYKGPSGLSFGLGSPIIAQTFPGVERLDQDWIITAAEGQVIQEINQRPALDVLKEVAGEILARKLDQLPSFLYAAFPVSEASPEDFLVRRINGLGRRSGSFSVEDEVLPGMPLAFARRNGPFVHQTLKQGIEDLRQRAGKPPRGAIYLYDHRRSVDFEGATGEVALVKEALGDIPLIHGAGQGVIGHNRFYALASQLIFIL